ncbi:TPA: hypothetical protein QCX06_004296 [Bacillus paranthracis]|nr:hypothetical protein [Bacillus paranthracis]HDR7306631.1 hypothetical protein [Bacillus paranthracis]
MSLVKEHEVYFDNLHECLSHLNNEKILNLINRYYDNESVQLLKLEYNIDFPGNSLLKILPYKIVGVCSMCKTKILERFEARNSYTSYYRNSFNSRACSKCGHIDNMNCSCENESCIEIRNQKRLEEEIRKEKETRLQRELMEKKKREEEEKRKILIEKIEELCNPSSYEKFNESQLNLKQRLYLGLFIRVTQQEESDLLSLTQIRRDNPPTPTIDYFIQILHFLVDNKLIVPSIDSSPDAFAVTAQGEIDFKRIEVKYWVNVEPSLGNYDDLVSTLIYPKSDLFLEDKEFCYNIWKKVAMGEILQYLEYSLDKVNFTFNPGKKTYQVFNHLLDYYAITQIYNIIYRAVAVSSKAFLEGKMTKSHATNSIITHCENYGAKAIVEKWKINPYFKNTPESVLSKMVFNDVLGIGCLGYEEKPTRDL